MAVSDSDEEGLVDHTTAPDGTRFTLCRRNDEFGIQVDGLELMSTEARTSEEALARLSCRHLADRPGAQILLVGAEVSAELAEFYSHLCPAGVYENDGGKLVVNAPNCVDCKATDVVGPRWSPREGGSGPRYRSM